MTKKTLKQNEIRITFAGRLKKRLIKILILQIAKSESKKEFFFKTHVPFWLEERRVIFITLN